MKKIVIAALLMLCLFTGCGQKVDKEKLGELQERITAIDTEIASIYGKIEDMHQSAKIDDENYAVFTDIDNRADKIMEESENAKDLDALETEIDELESDLNDFKAYLDSINEQRKDSLAIDLVTLSYAANEQESLMKRALENGQITQEKYDEFDELHTKINVYMMDGDLKYDSEFEKDINDIRQRLAALASEAGADNALIDRLIGSGTGEAPQEAESEESTHTTANDVQASDGNAEASTEPEAHELPPSAEELNMNYIAFQDFMLEKHNAGEITDAEMAALIKIGVELSYLKEAIEKDGLTENNTYTTQDIKARLYETAVEYGYENAEVFK